MKTILAKIWKALNFPKNIQLFIIRLFQDQFLVGVTGVIFNDKDEVLLFKHTYRAHSWSLPGGYLKRGEFPKDGLEREIKEESNFVVSIDEQLKTRTDRDGGRIDVCYIGKFIGGDFVKSHEVSEYGFFSFEKMPLLRKNQLFLVEDALRQRSGQK